MKEALRIASEYTILLIDGMALLTVAYASVEAFIRGIMVIASGATLETKRDVWLRFMRYLVVALSFQLAADIIETSISTTWEALVRISVIAVVRTFLNHFLEQDVVELAHRQRGRTT